MEKVQRPVRRSPAMAHLSAWEHRTITTSLQYLITNVCRPMWEKDSGAAFNVEIIVVTWSSNGHMLNLQAVPQGPEPIRQYTRQAIQDIVWYLLILTVTVSLKIHGSMAVRMME